MTAWKTWRRLPNGIRRARVTGRPSARTARSWAVKSTSRLTAERTLRCPRWYFLGGRSTLADRTTGRVFVFTRRPLLQTRRHMELFVALEHRRACLLWNGTWIASREP